MYSTGNFSQIARIASFSSATELMLFASLCSFFQSEPGIFDYVKIRGLCRPCQCIDFIFQLVSMTVRAL